jgi:hypothetical protein
MVHQAMDRAATIMVTDASSPGSSKAADETGLPGLIRRVRRSRSFWFSLTILCGLAITALAFLWRVPR